MAERPNIVEDAFLKIIVPVIGLWAVAWEIFKAHPVIAVVVIFLAGAYLVYQFARAKSVPGMLRFLFSILFGCALIGFIVPRLTRDNYIVPLPIEKLPETSAKPTVTVQRSNDAQEQTHRPRPHKPVNSMPAVVQGPCSINQTGGVNNRNTVNCNFGSAEGGVVELK
jgi:hypothetical protein